MQSKRFSLLLPAMNSGKAHCFIALLIPPPFGEEITRIKKHAAEKYHTRKALNSPPHITLISPFYTDEETLGRLSGDLQKFSGKHESVPVALNGYGAFEPRVIYVAVENNPALTKLHSELRDFLMPVYPQLLPKEERPFLPHITIAFRDLPETQFYRAWKEFERKKLHAEFKIGSLHLLRHHNRQWISEKCFIFEGRNS